MPWKVEGGTKEGKCRQSQNRGKARSSFKNLPTTFIVSVIAAASVTGVTA